jgi:AbrB family looped-hinge helix DNA binding protein
MLTRRVGMKGQVVIPKQMRDALGLKPGVEITLEMRDQEIVIKKLQVRGSYAEYFITTSSPKLKKQVNIKELMDQELEQRHPYLDSNTISHKPVKNHYLRLSAIIYPRILSYANTESSPSANPCKTVPPEDASFPKSAKPFQDQHPSLATP